jgi:hypothetical protein
VKDVIASYEKLVSIFERVHLFLGRLNCYAGIPLTTAMTELLGKTMAQVLSILALSTKVMNERRISESCDRIRLFSANDEIETFFKRVVGRTDVEDALLRLDTLTKEENLMATARTLEVTHHVDQGTEHHLVLIPLSTLFLNPCRTAVGKIQGRWHFRTTVIYLQG